ncbi:hypothetical protein [Komarekiella delphini-convector]|nr:hypothetical protein [Komarekiella delphini-convector]
MTASSIALTEQIGNPRKISFQQDWKIAALNGGDRIDNAAIAPCLCTRA